MNIHKRVGLLYGYSAYCETPITSSGHNNTQYEWHKVTCLRCLDKKAEEVKVKCIMNVAQPLKEKRKFLVALMAYRGFEVKEVSSE